MRKLLLDFINCLLYWRCMYVLCRACPLTSEKCVCVLQCRKQTHCSVPINRKRSTHTQTHTHRIWKPKSNRTSIKYHKWISRANAIVSAEVFQHFHCCCCCCFFCVYLLLELTFHFVCSYLFSSSPNNYIIHIYNLKFKIFNWYF